MRLKYYKLTLRQMVQNKPFVFFIILVFAISGFVTYAFNKNIMPTIKLLCESKASAIALRSSNISVYENIKDIKYEDLIVVQKDTNNKVTSLSANTVLMNKITSSVTTKLQDELEKNELAHITLPIGTLFGMQIVGGYGPNVNLKIVSTGEVNTKVKSKFESAGINQTKHSIILEVTANVMILAPFYTNTKSYVNEIAIAETVIVGDTPSSYYDIKGINSDQVLDLIE